MERERQRSRRVVEGDAQGRSPIRRLHLGGRRRTDPGRERSELGRNDSTGERLQGSQAEAMIAGHPTAFIRVSAGPPASRRST